MPNHKYHRDCIDDAFVDVESWFIEKVAEIFGTKENEAFIKGNCNFKPKGILAYNDDEVETLTNK